MPNVLDLFSVKGHWRAGMSRLQKYDDLAARIIRRLMPSLVGEKMALSPDSNCDNQDCWNPQCKCDPCECSKEKPCGYPEQDCCVNALKENTAHPFSEMG